MSANADTPFAAYATGMILADIREIPFSAVSLMIAPSTVLDIVFGDADRADLIVEPFEIADEKTKQVIKGNRYIVRTVDEDGKVYECTVKPARTSDRSLLQMLLAE